MTLSHRSKTSNTHRSTIKTDVKTKLWCCKYLTDDKKDEILKTKKTTASQKKSLQLVLSSGSDDTEGHQSDKKLVLWYVVKAWGSCVQKEYHCVHCVCLCVVGQSVMRGVIVFNLHVDAVWTAALPEELSRNVSVYVSSSKQWVTC